LRSAGLFASNRMATSESGKTSNEKNNTARNGVHRWLYSRRPERRLSHAHKQQGPRPRQRRDPDDNTRPQV
jgi:hypothetical protein